MGFFIFDLIVLIVLILAVIQGYRKGFVLTLCGFLARFLWRLSEQASSPTPLAGTGEPGHHSRH